MALDCAIIGLAATISGEVLVLSVGGYTWLPNRWLLGGTFCAAALAAGHVFGLYERNTLLARSRILVRSLLSLFLGVILAFAWLSVFFYASSSRWIGLAVIVTYCLIAIPLRLAAHHVITASPVRLLCVGAGPSIRKLVRLLARRHNPHYHVVGHVTVPAETTAKTGRDAKGEEGTGNGERETGQDTQERGTADGSDATGRFRSSTDEQFNAECPRLGTLDRVVPLLAEHGVDEIVVASELILDPATGGALASCLERCCRVTDQTTFVEKLLGEVPAETLAAEWFLRADVQNRSNYEAVRRMMDATVAALGLLLTLPLWPLVALAIRLDSPGPVLFRQRRVGQHGRLFTIYKFRTMRVDAEADGARWAVRDDPRVTRVGRFLRRSRLDELPQLLNILRGDMALVGPRPERPEFVRQLEQLLPHYRLRHLIKPGLTGWAQIHYGYGGSVADALRKLCYDLYYLKHRALELDVAILFRTLGTFVLGAR
ncbi:MAG: sugar transferase [Planctomycetota bacterium]